MTSAEGALHAFGGFGIELEYVLVDRDTLEVRPISDELLRDASGSVANSVSHGRFGFSNELVMHLIELKSERPETSYGVLANGFQDEVGAINRQLAAHGACLLPTGMHPWMDPRSQTRLWPHEYAGIYRTYDEVFDCRRHGWANVQSMHVNLPFAGDAELARLLAAVRHVLPILPALAASSPFCDSTRQPDLDTRMRHYLTHAVRVPSMLGDIVPETVSGERDYRTRILEPMYREIAPFDRENMMRDEWLNARGAIARFDRNAVEIRVLDTQECPAMDVAVAAATVAAVRACYEGMFGGGPSASPFSLRVLRGVLDACIRDADEALITDREYLATFSFPGTRARAGEQWQHLIESTLERGPADAATCRDRLALILTEGTLARRIVRAVGDDVSRPRLREVYLQLADCLAAGRPFRAGG